MIGARSRGSIHGSRALAGWLFITPAILIIGLFVLVPVVMAAWVSMSDWSGIGPPFAEGVNFVGTDNYEELLGGTGLATRDLGTALRNNLFYVLLVVPLQTAASLGLAILVNRRVMRARGFFRTAFYFPSVTSSVAIVVLWLFLFSATGPVNKLLSWVWIDGPNWFQDPRGVFHIALGAFGVTGQDNPLSGAMFMGITGWDWVSGPSVAMSAFILMAVFTTSGTFMLLFIAALQQINAEVEEAAMTDGANAWQRFRFIVLPALRAVLVTLVILRFIFMFTKFDLLYLFAGSTRQTRTLPIITFLRIFGESRLGAGAALAVLLFGALIATTTLYLWLTRRGEAGEVA